MTIDQQPTFFHISIERICLFFLSSDAVKYLYHLRRDRQGKCLTNPFPAAKAMFKRSGLHENLFTTNLLLWRDLFQEEEFACAYCCQCKPHISETKQIQCCKKHNCDKLKFTYARIGLYYSSSDIKI